jgi:4-hydroxy-tetrahydrodipicolinate synthase
VPGPLTASPRETVAIWDLVQQGRIPEAREIYRWFAPLLHLDTDVKLVQYIKLAVQEVGLGRETCRAPRLDLAGAERERVLQVIRDGIASRPALPDSSPPGGTA